METLKSILEYVLALDPVMFSIGPLPIRWYALAYMAGFLIGWRLALYLVRRSQDRPNHDDIDEFLTWAVIGVILGGRLGYILFYQFDLYASAPLEALKIWHGGMSFHGGMIGVITAMFLFSWRHKIPVLRLSDIVATVVPIGLFFGRIANFINGELYGRTTDHPIGLVFPHSDGLPRHPSQLYEAVLEGLVLFTVLMLLRRISFVKNTSGMISGVFLVGYGIARMFVEQFREPDAHLGFIVQGLSMGQILSLPMVICGLVLAGFAYISKKSV